MQMIPTFECGGSCKLSLTYGNRLPYNNSVWFVGAGLKPARTKEEKRRQKNVSEKDPGRCHKKESQ